MNITKITWFGTVAAGFGRIASRLFASISGASATEFALALPVLTTFGMYGTEIAYMSSVNMQVTQLAASVGDNASRIGQTDNSSVTPTVTEVDINSVMTGALKQGQGFNFQTKGKIVLSSLEKNSSTGEQYIHWRRCAGSLNKTTQYLGSVADGMGQGSNKIKATSSTSSVMFVEIFYRYDGLFGTTFVDNVEFKQEAAFLTRDDRNLTPGITGTGSTSQC